MTVEETGPEQASSAALSLLADIRDRPAVILGRRNDILAWDDFGHALIAPHLDTGTPADPARRPSLPRLLFLDPQVRGMYSDWEREAADYVAYLRLISGKYAGDAELMSMIGELCVGDKAFAELWARGQVGECVAGTKRMVHPTSGRITVDFQLWAQADQPDQRLEIYRVRSDPDGSKTRALLSALPESARSRTAR